MRNLNKQLNSSKGLSVLSLMPKKSHGGNVKLIWVAALILISSGAYAKETNTGSKAGRFQIVQLSDMRRDQVLIDTQTGQVWHQSCLIPVPDGDGSSCTYGAWFKDEIEDITKKAKQIYSTATAIKKMNEPDSGASNAGGLTPQELDGLKDRQKKN